MITNQTSWAIDGNIKNIWFFHVEYCKSFWKYEILIDFYRALIFFNSCKPNKFCKNVTQFVFQLCWYSFMKKLLIMYIFGDNVTIDVLGIRQRILQFLLRKFQGIKHVLILLYKQLFKSIFEQKNYTYNLILNFFVFCYL